jgi:uncharacterized protein YecE (DUF72 family)
LGCSGFYYNHWLGRFYPAGLAKKEWLNFYAQQFNTVEINNTFYRFPTKELLQSWYNKTPENFQFTVKANRQITHTRKFHDTETATNRFYELTKVLKEKLACVLFQLPPQLHKNLELLERIADQMDKDVVNVLEFRDESWWSPDVYRLMRMKGLVFCSVSAEALPANLVKTSDVMYVRFHGKDGWYGGDYSTEELRGWAEKIRAANAEAVYGYFNNDVGAYAPKNCHTLKGLLEKNQTTENQHTNGPVFNQTDLPL